jgi:membrane protease YdiL (CAAX protease family)
MGILKATRINKLSFLAMIVMTILSFTNLFGISIAGTSVIIGVVFFFINKRLENSIFTDSGLDFVAIKSNFKDKSIYFYFVMPTIMDGIAMIIAVLFVPQYFSHVLGRSLNFVSAVNPFVLVFQLAFLALGEEIAWRAFFQKQLLKILPITPVLIFSSILFALGHYPGKGNFFIVFYDLFFVFINSVLYGIIFHKTNNAYISGLSHFIANLLSFIVLLLL